MIRNTWFAAGFSAEFPAGALQRRIIAGRPIVMWRTRHGEVVGLDARCVHKCFPLWHGRLLDNDRLECGYHGFTFDSSGRCVTIPALHDERDRIPQAARQVKFPVTEKNGLVWIWPGNSKKSEEIGVPDTPEIDGPDWETRNAEPVSVRANYRLLIENLFDLTHFYPLHAGNIGSLADARVPVEIIRSTWAGNPIVKTIRRRAPQSLPPTTRDRFGLEHGEQLQVHQMIGPGLFQVHVSVAPEGCLGTTSEQGFVLYQTITPESEDTLIWRRSTSCRVGTKWAADRSKPLVDAILAGAPVVVAQDKWAIEQQQEMLAFADDGYREVHVKTDGAMMMARQVLNRMETAEREASTDQVLEKSARAESPRRVQEQKEVL